MTTASGAFSTRFFETEDEAHEAARVASRSGAQVRWFECVR